MNNIDIEKIKREIKVKVGGTVVFCGLLLTLMGCGKTNNDTVVTPEPDTTIETVVEPEDEITIPTVDVSDNEEIAPVEDDNKLPEPTFVQTGDNSYTLYVDCQDNSNAPEIQAVLTIGDSSCISNYAEEFGISENLIIATMAYGIQDNSNDLLLSNLDNYKEIEMSMIDFCGDTQIIVITDEPDSHVEAYTLEPKSDAFMFHNIFKAYTAILRDSISSTNGNISCAVARTYAGPEAWEQVMRECMDATGLTEEKIYAYYNADDVLQYDTLGLCDHECANTIMSYIGDEPIVIQNYGTDRIESVDTYTIERSKALRLR